MPVVEYKMHAVTNKEGISAPLWIKDGGYHTSPIDHTKVGWVRPESEREYYVPDTVTELSKTDFINRQLGIHAINPMVETRDSAGEFVDIELDSAQVTSISGAWYDSFVSSNS